MRLLQDDGTQIEPFISTSVPRAKSMLERFRVIRVTGLIPGDRDNAVEIVFSPEEWAAVLIVLA